MGNFDDVLTRIQRQLDEMKTSLRSRRPGNQRKASETKKVDDQGSATGKRENVSDRDRET